MALTQLKTGAIADDAVTTDKLANAINTERTANTAKVSLADNSVTLAKMAGGTDGQIITYDASGDPVAVGPGTDGQVLTSTGAGSPPAFEDSSGTTINNNADNRVITGSDSSGTLNGEASVVIDSSSRLLVGKTASKNSDGDGTALVQFESTGRAMLDIASNGTTSANYAALNLIRSDGSSVNDHTAVDSGDRIGRINFIGADGSDRFNSCASIRAFAAADFTANNCPGYLTISTNSGGAAPSERVRFLSSGGMTFNGDTATANALDDYEEGTWTPDWRGASALGTTSYGTYNTASYVKIGNQVTVRGFSDIDGSSGGSGIWFINNLPFTVAGGDNRAYRSVGSVMIENFNLQDSENGGDLVCFVERNNNDMQLRGNRDDESASNNIKVSQDANFEVFFTITYPTA